MGNHLTRLANVFSYEKRQSGTRKRKNSNMSKDPVKEGLLVDFDSHKPPRSKK